MDAVLRRAAPLLVVTIYAEEVRVPVVPVEAAVHPIAFLLV